MPSSSRKQHNFMEAIKHSPSFAAKAGVPQSVGQDFVAADKTAGSYQPVIKDAPARAGKKKRSVHKATSANGMHKGFFNNRGRAFGAAGPNGDVQMVPHKPGMRVMDEEAGETAPDAETGPGETTGRRKGKRDTRAEEMSDTGLDAEPD
jgi:hypothetical protein